VFTPEGPGWAEREMQPIMAMLRRRPDRLRGTPSVLVAARNTLTGKHLAAYVGLG
jgi:hypothetical protein